MKKRESMESNDEMRAEYDFRGAVRGRHYKPLHEGYTVEVHQADGTTLVQQVKLEEGTVLLDPDVRAWFSDSASVNQALRSLIMLMEQMPAKGKKKKSPKETPVSA